MVISEGNVSTCVYFIQLLEWQLRGGGAVLKWAGNFIRHKWTGNGARKLKIQVYNPYGQFQNPKRTFKIKGG